MSKTQQKLDISVVAKLFGQTEKYTAAMLDKHGITSLPHCRQPNDGLDAFYSDMTAFFNEEPSLTKQEFTQQCDPNFILDRHARGQDISLQMNANPSYGDFTNLPNSYHEALTIVTQARQSFMSLDAKIRAKFDNDPGQFVDFVSNPENAQALIQMGLATPKPEQTPAPQAGAAPASNEVSGGGEGA